MKPGTPNFVGMRLREAREARELTMTALGDLIGVSRQAISQYELERVTPHPEVMRRLAGALNLPESFFWQPPTAQEAPLVFFRSQASATKAAQTRAERRHGWLRSIASYVEQYVQFPVLNLPEQWLTSDPSNLTSSDIESAAFQTRRFWGLGNGPIGNLVRLFEKNGLVVSCGVIESGTLDAFSAYIQPRPCVFFALDKGSAVRSRFDIAHELAHLVLHANLDARTVTHYHKLLESQAQAFASAFLLPAESFADDVVIPSLDTFRSLKSKWYVSIGAMIKRAETLGLVDVEGTQRLWRTYSSRGWKRGEPLDDELQTEQPQLLAQAVAMIVDHGVRSRAQIREALPYSTRDIEALAGLPEGYMDDDAPLLLRLQEHSAAKKIVPFPSTRSR